MLSLQGQQMLTDFGDISAGLHYVKYRGTGAQSLGTHDRKEMRTHHEVSGVYELSLILSVHMRMFMSSHLFVGVSLFLYIFVLFCVPVTLSFSVIRLV